MTKDVLLSISGLHQDVTGIEAQGDEPGNEFSEWQAFFYVRGGHGRSERIDQEHD